MTSSHQTKWKSRAVLAGVLAVGVLVSCLLIGKMRERKPFVSKGVKGYRYRCTLSNDWKLTPTVSSGAHGTVESYTFSASPSPIREWIATHLLHHPPATGGAPGNPNNEQSQLMLITETGKTAPEIKIQAGYPEVDLGHQTIPGLKVIPGKHLRIDNCPATMAGLDLTALGLTSRYNFVLVCTPDYANTYIVGCIASPPDSDQAEREMQAVIASFHVEKVAAPASSKR